MQPVVLQGPEAAGAARVRVEVMLLCDRLVRVLVCFLFPVFFLEGGSYVAEISEMLCNLKTSWQDASGNWNHWETWSWCCNNGLCSQSAGLLNI